MTDSPQQAHIVRNQATPEHYFSEQCHITECWNSPEDPQASVAQARVEPGITTRLHFLRGITERYVILAGSGVANIRGLTPAELGPGDVVVIPPDTPQQITNNGSNDLIFLAICTPRFTPEVYHEIDGDT